MDNEKEMRSLALTPTWSVATVLTIFVAVSLIVERSIHRLSHVSSWFLASNFCFVFKSCLLLLLKEMYYAIMTIRERYSKDFGNDMFISTNSYFRQ